MNAPVAKISRLPVTAFAGFESSILRSAACSGHSKRTDPVRLSRAMSLYIVLRLIRHAGARPTATTSPADERGKLETAPRRLWHILLLLSPCAGDRLSQLPVLRHIKVAEWLAILGLRGTYMQFMMTLHTLHKVIFKEPMPGRKCYAYRIRNKYWYQVFPI